VDSCACSLLEGIPNHTRVLVGNLYLFRDGQSTYIGECDRLPQLPLPPLRNNKRRKKLVLWDDDLSNCTYTLVTPPVFMCTGTR